MGIDVLMGQILALSGVAVLGLLAARITGLDRSLACLIAGFGFGFLPALLDFDTGLRAASFKDLILFVFIPVLVFEAAWKLEPALLKRWLVPALMLAIPGVAVGALVLAGITFVLMGHEVGYPLLAALLTGVILAATDPVSVVSTLHDAHAPEDLSTLVEAESLFNDATAILLFGVVLALATGEMTAGLGDQIWHFIVTFVGGAVVGALIALVAAIVVLGLGTPATANVVLVLTAFGSFYVAEHLLHVSGIVAVMIAAIVTRVALHEHEQRLLPGGSASWDWMSGLLNAVLFVVLGLVITLDMFQTHWLAMLIVILAGLCARAAAVYFSCGLSRLVGKPVPMDWQHVLTWGGLRGAIAIALVLSLPISLPYWWTIQAMVFGLVLFTLVVSGPTTALLLRKLRLIE